jgi:hypothetical protein
MAVLLLEMFSPTVGNSECTYALSNTYFYDLDKPGTPGVANRILRAAETEGSLP